MAPSRSFSPRPLLAPIALRRLLALLTNIAMLHLTVVGGGFVCRSHDGATDVSMPGMSMDHATSGAHDSATSASMAVAKGGAPSNHQGDAAPQPRCCSASSGCGVTMTVALARRDAEVPAKSGGLPGIIRNSPPSTRPAPEPPPPKG